MLPIDLNGRVACVTGVSSGIGKGIAMMLAQAGCHIAGCGRSAVDSADAGSFIELVESKGRRATYREMDLTITQQLDNFVESAAESFGRIDILVSNAGLNVFRGAEGASEEDWEFNMNLNLKAHWLLAKKAKPFLEKSPSATIIIISSNHAYNTMKGCFPYNVSKAGLLGLVQALAIDWGPVIRTVGLAPGFIKTDASESWFASFDDPEAEWQRAIEKHPAGKLGSIEEIGALCAFLASEYAGFITGTTYLVDGGRSAVLQD